MIANTLILEDGLRCSELLKLRELKGVKLLVIDDLKDIEEHETTIAKILALKEHGYQILFTSREEMDNDKITPFYLDVLNLTDAKNLFKAIYPVPVEDESLLEAILGYLDCHTLFVELTAKTLKNKKTITLQMLKEKFDSEEFSKVSIKRRESFGKYLSKLFVIDQLDNEETLVLKQLAVLPSIEIPFSLLQTVFNPEDNEDFEEILNYLSEKGWLISSNDGYKLHQIIKEFILAKHPPEFEKEVLPLVENINPTEEYIELDSFIELKTNFIEIEIMIAITDRYLARKHKKIIQLAILLGATYRYFGRYTKALLLEKEVVIIREKLLGEKDLYTSQSYNSLAGIHEAQGNYNDALYFYNKALSIRIEVLGEKDPNTATLYNNLALLYKKQSNYDKALSFYKKSLFIRKKELGDYNHHTATSYNNIAGLYSTKGNNTKAIKFYEKALKIYQNIFGEYDSRTATIYNNIAQVYWLQSDYKNALLLYEKSLTIREKVLNKQHPDIINSYNNLAVLYHSKGDCFNAELFYKKVLLISKKTFGEYHPNVAVFYNNFADFYLKQDDSMNALLFFEKALVIREKILGEQHPHTAMSYNGLAMSYKSKGSYDKALPLYKKALAVMEKSLGEHHPNTETIYRNLIELYESKGSFRKALEIWKKVLKEPSSTILCQKLAHHHMESKNCQRTKYYAEQVNNPPMKQLLKQIKWNIKKAKKLTPKRSGKYCKNS